MNIHRVNASAAKVQVTDWSLWIKHIKGDKALVQHLTELAEGETITLRIGGHEGVWEKKADGKDGRPTQGLKPLGAMKGVWFDWFRSERGALVDIIATHAVAPSRPLRAQLDGLVEEGDPQDRAAAWSAFLALRHAGWRFDRAGALDRASLHERGAR